MARRYRLAIAPIVLGTWALIRNVRVIADHQIHLKRDPNE